MITDNDNLALMPGNNGNDCPRNGNHVQANGQLIECCCDECDFMMCCLEAHTEEICEVCNNYRCPRTVKKEISP